MKRSSRFRIAPSEPVTVRDRRRLRTELGVELQNLTTDGGEELYFFQGAFHTPKDMIDPGKQAGAFTPIAKQIAEDQAKLTDKDENWTAHARKLEEAGYLEAIKSFRGRLPHTEFRLTAAGRKALQRYLDHMEALIRTAREA